MTDIARLPRAERITYTCNYERLNNAERDRRCRAIQTAINRARSPYPNAAAHLEHWLNNTGRRLDVPLTRIDFLHTDSGLPQFLLRKHRPVIARGHRAGFTDVDADAIGIEGRLALPSIDPRSLQPPGREQVLDWQDSLRATMWSFSQHGSTAAPQLERDLSIALGGYIAHSRVKVKARPPVRTNGRVIQVVEVVSWKVQICDRYDWIVSVNIGNDVVVAGCFSGIAPIAIPPNVVIPPIPRGAGTVTIHQGERIVNFNDKWMGEVERAGGAKAYEIFSEIFDAPANVRANFESINGTIRL